MAIRSKLCFAAAAVASLAVGAGSARAAELTESNCIVMATGPDGKVKQVLDKLPVLQLTRTQDAITLAVPAGFSHAAIDCMRSDIIPAPDDWKVLQAGYPLDITVPQDGGPARIIALESLDGHLQVRMVQGTLSQAEAERAQVRINELQTAMQDAFVASKSQR